MSSNLYAPVLEPKDVPRDVSFTKGFFVNQQGLTLTTFSFDRLSPQPPVGVVYLAHGYSSHTLFDWLLPEEPGGKHNTYEGSLIHGLVESGFAVRALDHTGHGQSPGTRCYFDSFDIVVDEAASFVDTVTVSY
jgi:alpha-beta hydrolase superfamily lysophospholipase